MVICLSLVFSSVWTLWFNLFKLTDSQFISHVYIYHLRMRSIPSQSLLTSEEEFLAFYFKGPEAEVEPFHFNFSVQIPESI